MAPRYALPPPKHTCTRLNLCEIYKCFSKKKIYKCNAMGAISDETYTNAMGALEQMSRFLNICVTKACYLDVSF
jgi:hypothetical protein